MSHRDRHSPEFGTDADVPRVTPEELAQTRASMMLVLDCLTATSIPELEAAVEKWLKEGAHFGPTAARIIEQQRTKLGRASRPS